MKSPFENLDPASVLPLGRHPNDQGKPSLEPIDFQLSRIQTHLFWIDEHLATYDTIPDHASTEAREELSNARDSCKTAKEHLLRLTELLLIGHKPSRVLGTL